MGFSCRDWDEDEQSTEHCEEHEKAEENEEREERSEKREAGIKGGSVDVQGSSQNGRRNEKA